MNSISNRKLNIKKHADGIAESRDKWINKNSYYYNNDISYMKFLVGENKRILDLGCGTGKLLSALNPSYGVGVDISSNMISIAQKNYPKHEFIIGDIRNEKIGYKIREHSNAKIPVLIIIGKQEAENKQLSVRRLGSNNTETFDLETIINALAEEAKSP